MSAYIAIINVHQARVSVCFMYACMLLEHLMAVERTDRIDTAFIHDDFSFIPADFSWDASDPAYYNLLVHNPVYNIYSVSFHLVCFI